MAGGALNGAVCPGAEPRLAKALDGWELVDGTEEGALKGLEPGVIKRFTEAECITPGAE